MAKKLLFIQLPIPRLKLLADDHNIPVAAYYLHAYLQGQPIAEFIQSHVLDPVIQNYGSDETILRAIEAIAPDIIGFSLFCWNIERSLYLAKRLKASSAFSQSPTILAGGPEVTPDNPLLADSAVDLYVYGEGEYTLHAVLEDWLRHQKVTPTTLPGTLYFLDGARQVNPPQTLAVNINAAPSPYLTGHVPHGYWTQMFFETMRGCPYACRFCYYNKQCGSLRFLKQETVLELLQYAVNQHYGVIFLLDPSFNIRPDLEELLIKMAQINAGHPVKIATELRADMIDEHLAQLLAEAGVYEVEIGLQSIHADTIAQIGRTQRLDDFLRGTLAMSARGIETKVDLIIGLPGDNLEKFKASARWVKHSGLDEYLQVFCLSVLPGTWFREHAAELGLHYCSNPPYYLLNSPDWSAADIQEALSWAEDYFGITFEADMDEELTLTPVLKNEYRLHEIMRVNPDQPLEIPASTTYLTKWLFSPIRSEDDLFRHLKTCQRYTKNNPYSTFFVYLDLQSEIALESLFDFYAAFASLKQQFIDRDLGILSIEETPVFHYQLEIFIRQPRAQNFSAAYLASLEQYFHVEIVENIGSC